MGNLEKVIEIRNSIKEQEIFLNSIMPDAILEALYLLNSDNSNQVVFRNKLGKIVLVYRKRFIPIKQSKTLSKIDELIKFHQTILAGSHQQQLIKINAEIEELSAKIKELKIEQDKLLSNSSIITLKTEFIKVTEEESYLEPTLSIYLK